jgi:hypothetical protein
LRIPACRPIVSRSWCAPPIISISPHRILRKRRAAFRGDQFAWRSLRELQPAHGLCVRRAAGLSAPACRSRPAGAAMPTADRRSRMVHVMRMAMVAMVMRVPVTLAAVLPEPDRTVMNSGQAIPMAAVAAISPRAGGIANVLRSGVNWKLGRRHRRRRANAGGGACNDERGGNHDLHLTFRA